jgi:hypothetical protein
MPPLNIIWWVVFIIWLLGGFSADNPSRVWQRPARHFVTAILLVILAIAVFGK